MFTGFDETNINFGTNIGYLLFDIEQYAKKHGKNEKYKYRPASELTEKFEKYKNKYMKEQ